MASVVLGCPISSVESQFQLADSSRLPSWYVMTPGLTREDIHITVTFHTQGNVDFEIRGPKGLLVRETGKHKWHPLTLERGFVEKPSYSVISVRGFSDIYEQRKPEPLLYIIDDPKLKAMLHRDE